MIVWFSYTTLTHWLFLAYEREKKNLFLGFLGSLTNCYSSMSNETKVFVKAETAV